MSFDTIVWFFSKSKKEKAVEKDGRKIKKKLQRQESDDNKGLDKKSSKKIRSKKEDEDENGSSSEEDVDLSRGEGDVQSSSEEEDEGQLKLKIKEVSNYLLLYQVRIYAGFSILRKMGRFLRIIFFIFFFQIKENFKFSGINILSL